MADIAKNLKNILSAVFGKDVRQSIHDGLKAINDESVERLASQDDKIEKNTIKQNLLEKEYEEQIKELANGEPQLPEIVNARAGFNTLRKVVDQKIYHFDSIEEMKRATCLVPGNVCVVLGNLKMNDGNISKYKIVNNNELVANDDDIIAIANGIYAIKIKNSILKFHAVAKSSATYIVEFPNGQIMLIDTGLKNQWEHIKLAIDTLNIQKIDYIVITHFHGDHAGNIQNIIDNYDTTNCKWYIQMKPDFVNHADDLADTEEEYDSYLNLFEQNGIIPIVPQNGLIVELDKYTKIRFLNTSLEMAENYYNKNAEWYTHGKINFNYFSLVTEIIHKNVRILSTGDLEAGVEEQLTPYMQKYSIITVPHHGINRDAYIPFYQAIMPDFAIASYITDENNWVRTEMKGFMQLKNQGCKMITPKWSLSENGLFSFESDGNNVSSSVLSSGLAKDTCENHQIFAKLDELIDFSNRLQTEITLQELLNNMPTGSYLSAIRQDTFANRYAQIYNDIQEIFLNHFDLGMRLEIFRDAMVANTFTIKIFNGVQEFVAFSQRRRKLAS